jgi:hypothetical protein
VSQQADADEDEDEDKIDSPRTNQTHKALPTRKVQGETDCLTWMPGPRVGQQTDDPTYRKNQSHCQDHGMITIRTRGKTSWMMTSLSLNTDAMTIARGSERRANFHPKRQRGTNCEAPSDSTTRDHFLPSMS